MAIPSPVRVRPAITGQTGASTIRSAAATACVMPILLATRSSAMGGRTRCLVPGWRPRRVTGRFRQVPGGDRCPAPSRRPMTVPSVVVAERVPVLKGASFMEPNQFDRITQFFATRRLSRRQALRHTGTGLAAAGLAAAGLGSAAAQDATPAAGGTKGESDPTFLFVQSFQSGSLAPKDGADGAFTLTL